jgi:hypothetical protein
MQDIRQAFRDVFPHWLALCLIAVIFGLAMQLLPGFMEGANYYPTTWAANLAHADPTSYLLVAEQGYGAEGRGLQTSVRFPLFPFLTRATIQLTGIDPDVSMFILSKAALLVGLIGIWLLVAHLHGREQAERAALYVIFPLLGSGYTWMMSYNEPLHLALWTFGFLLLYKRQYALCGLLTILNVWTRPHSVVILPCFALVLVTDALREGGVRGLLDRDLWLRGIVTCGLPLLAFSAWMLHISRLTEIPLSPFTAQGNYGREGFMLPWIRLANILLRPFRPNPPPYTFGLLFEYFQDVLIVVGLVAMAVVALRKRLPWALVLFSVLSLAPGLSTANYALGRFALLTWIPVALTYVVPQRFDKTVIPIAISLSFLALVLLGLVGGFIVP